MLSVNSLREHCRMCLVKLDVGSSTSIPIIKFPDLERLVQICIDESFCFHAPFICCSCFNKWYEFLKTYQQAVETDKKIRAILERGILKTDNIKHQQYEGIQEYFINSETLLNVHEIEKYETNSPFYLNSSSSITLNNNTSLCDDPTQTNKIFIDTMNSTELVLRQNEHRSIVLPGTGDFDGTNEYKNKKNIQTPNTRKGTSSRGPLCAFKKNYKTRKPPLKNSRKQTDLENSTKRVRYECEQCSQYFWQKNKYDGHIKQVHEGIKRPYKCQQCDKKYNLYKTLLQHKRECHDIKSNSIFECKRCDKLFKTGVILKQHLVNKHSERKESMRSICDQCGFIAAHQYSLSRHIINKHTEQNQIKCNQCPKVFKSQYSLKYHVLGNHNPSNKKPFNCTECEMGFTRKTLLNQHKRTHLKYNERIKCDFEGCEVRFVKRGDKTHHMRLVHLKVKHHICDICGEAFGAMQTLRHHRFIHTGEKPYKCNLCGQGFRQRTAMKTHRNTHFRKGSKKHDLPNNLQEINLTLVNNINMNS